LAALLLRLSAASDGAITGYTHQDLADMVGTYRETITQTLNEFKSTGPISIGRKRVDVLDSLALQELAEI
jgi:CRP-like cAMP-binding protein